MDAWNFNLNLNNNLNNNPATKGINATKKSLLLYQRSISVFEYIVPTGLILAM